MAARYWVLASDELIGSDPQWPEGLRVIRRDDSAPPPDGEKHWYLFEDDTASPSLDGKKVELSFGQGGAAYGRRMVG
jgi:hypothetical protein